MHARDRQLALEQARQGDSRALGLLLESFRPYVRVIVQGVGEGRLRARVETSDLIQDTMLEAHRSFGQFRGVTVAELAVWLRQIALRSAGHSVRTMLGTGKRDPAREEAVADLDALTADSGSSPSAQAIRQEQATQMTAVLAQLPLDMQQVLLGRHVDGLPHAAIAQQLGRSEAAVRVLYIRALDRLRELCKG